MPVKFFLVLLILAQFVCVSALCEIISHWFKKKDICELSFLSNLKRGSK